MPHTETENPTRRRRSRAKAGSARNGAVRVVCFVPPEKAEAISAVCIELGITRGEFLASHPGLNAKRGGR